MSFARHTALVYGVILLSCTSLPPRLGANRIDLGDGPPTAAAAEAPPDAGSGDDMEREEQAHEDPGALAALIADKLADSPTPADTAPPPALAAPLPGNAVVPTGRVNLALSPEQCLARLEQAGVRTRPPGFETELVETPLLLDGPVEGVEIVPRWPRAEPVNAVMDCHLVLALVGVARQARQLGIKEIRFYSTYRPLKKKRDSSGRRISQHRRALAIDIRWLVTDDGRTIDLLEAYERRDGEPPCESPAAEGDARLLQDFACGLHRDRIFNVVLTPNANKAHHNHFHFDLTPGASWYIAR
ncbi:MAG: extensin family protein [Deltaproteobacteria bacterium]|jgi:hypothetical protein|nr:extensin family protein [Deltaproteobacteria bacterium]